MEKILTFLNTQFDRVYIPKMNITDIIEIIIISVVIYYIINWFKTTRAWVLLKGILVLLFFMGIAAIFKLNTILWIFENTINVGIIALIIVFQPEFRRVLEQLGRRNIVSSLFSFDEQKDKTGRFNEKTINEIVKASFEMSKTKTGSLMVIEKQVALGEYERTGIKLDGVVSSQLLENIFEHNTPLHDGAVIIRGNRIVAATCYLPLTDSIQVSKELGTRHRAGLGISEVSDSLTIIVSEETGHVSVAVAGKLVRNIAPDHLRGELNKFMSNSKDSTRFGKWKERVKHETKN